MFERSANDEALEKRVKGALSPQQLARMKSANNPNNEPTGHYTGRCMKCGSNDLWDDNLAYGCRTCHAIYTPL